MSLKLPEIQATLNELKNDSRAMQNAEVRKTVEHIEEILSELELKPSLIDADDVSTAQYSTHILERLTSIASQVFRESPQKEPMLWILHPVS
jgi:hypothetical protein